MARYTKGILADHMRRLLASRTLDEITVTGLVEESGMNRKTFYHNFRDKVDLAAYAVCGDLRALTDGLFTQRDWKLGTRNALAYVAENRAMFDNLIRSSAWPEVRRELEALMRETYTTFTVELLAADRADCAYEVDPPDPTVRFIIDFYSTSVFALISDWYRRGMPQTPDEFTEGIAVMFDNAIVESFDRLSLRS